MITAKFRAKLSRTDEPSPQGCGFLGMRETLLDTLMHDPAQLLRARAATYGTTSQDYEAIMVLSGSFPLAITRQPGSRGRWLTTLSTWLSNEMCLTRKVGQRGAHVLPMDSLWTPA